MLGKQGDQGLRNCRQRTAERNEPRKIDIDLIYAGGESIHTDTLTLPHPRWKERRFVLQPLADIRPDLQIPPETRTVSEMLVSLPALPGVTRLAEKW